MKASQKRSKEDIVYRYNSDRWSIIPIDKTCER